MAETSGSEIGVTNNSPDASMKRFETRQEQHQSTEGMVTFAARSAEQDMQKEAAQKSAEAAHVPDVVEVKRFLGIPVSRIEKWFKRSSTPQK